MNNFYKGGRGMACGQSHVRPLADNKVTKLLSDKPDHHIQQNTIIHSLWPKAYSLLLIFVSMFSLSDAWAQSLDIREAAEGQIEIKPLQVGDRVPDIFWSNAITIYRQGELIRTSLTSFKGKPLLVDFWNTWCTTCIAHMPDLYESGPYKDGKMNILLVTDDDPEKVQTFFANKEIDRKYHLESVAGNKDLHQYFEHGSVPFYVLLNEDGVVQTMTGLADLNWTDIKNMVDDKDTFRVSNITTNIKSFPALLAQKFSEEPGFYYSYFFRGPNSILGGGNINRKNADKSYSVSMLNIEILQMYSSIARYYYWEQGIPFHYSFVKKRADLPMLSEVSTFEYSVPTTDNEDFFLRTLDELNKYTGLNAHFQLQKKAVRIIHNKGQDMDIATIHTSTLKSSGFTGNVSKFFNDGMPVFDVSSVQKPAIDNKLLDHDLNIEKALSAKGLVISLVEIEFPILIIE